MEEENGMEEVCLEPICFTNQILNLTVKRLFNNNFFYYLFFLMSMLTGVNYAIN